jgi:hypothetical protein
MTINDLRKLDREEVLGWLGLESEPSSGGRLATSLGLVGLGLFVGTAITLLLAPKSGRAIREDIRNRFARDKGSDGMTDATVTREDVTPEAAPTPH